MAGMPVIGCANQHHIDVFQIEHGLIFGKALRARSLLLCLVDLRGVHIADGNHLGTSLLEVCHYTSPTATSPNQGHAHPVVRAQHFLVTGSGKRGSSEGGLPEQGSARRISRNHGENYIALQALYP